MRLDPSAALAGHPIDEIEVLRVAFEDAPAEAVLEAVLDTFPGQVAMVSSFGAEAAVLLKMVADIDRDLPVLMIDSLLLFEETIDYQRTLSRPPRPAQRPAHPALARGPPARRPRRHAPPARPGRLLRDPQGAAARPGAPALAGVDHRAQALPGLDPDGAPGHRARRRPAKVNPLARWSAQDLRDYMDAHDLPRHPLVARGFRSIGCAPCTTPVREGEDDRAGRWRGSEKVECGIHFGADGRILRAAS